MSDEQWQAPGHEHTGRDAGPEVGGGLPPQPLPQPGPPPSGVPPVSPPPPSPFAAPAGESAPSSSAFGTSERHRDQVLGGTGYHTPAYRNHPGAVAALVLGLVGVIVPGVALFAVATGHLALRRLRDSYDGGRGLAVTGLVLGYAMVAVWLAVLLLNVSGSGL